jgi:hypothetical protein
MAEIDFTNPLTVIAGFFGMIISIFAVILRFGMIGGFMGMLIGVFTGIFLAFRQDK